MRKHKVFGIMSGIILVGILLCSGLVVGALTVDPSSVSITRGGVINPGDPVIGSFTVDISDTEGLKRDDVFILGFTINPQNMTGEFCDRPPVINDKMNINPTVVFDNLVSPTDNRPIGFIPTAGTDFAGASFYQLSPNGVLYPSDNPDIVYKWGTRYNALAMPGPKSLDKIPVVINTTYPDEKPGWIMSMKEGTYNLRVQKYPYANVDDDVVDVPVTVKFGEMNVDITPLYQSLFRITGKNTDSNRTYLWITGDGLPDCGANLTYEFAQPVSGVPTIIGNYSISGVIPEVPGSGEYSESGDFDFDWRIPPTLKPGHYVLWASSVNPSEIEGLDGGSWASADGVCGLGCDICAPYARAEFEVGVWEMGDPVLDKDTITLDCCNHSMCTTCPDYPSVILRGQLNIKGIPGGFPLQVWIFGEDKVGALPLVFGEFSTFSDDASSYEIDITRLLLDNGITVCDLENGKYSIVVQSKGLQNGQLHPVFDITHERTFAFMGEPVFDNNHWFIASSHPYSKFPIDWWSTILMISGLDYQIPDISQNPGYYPLFPVEGPDSLGGKKAFNAFIKALNQDFIHDQYRIVTLTVNNTLCRDEVNFVGTPLSGDVPLNVSFTDLSTYKGTEYHWTFGDGHVSTIKDPYHLYEEPGLYDVSLTILDASGYHTKNKYEYICATEKNASFSAVPKYGNPPLTVSFVDTSMRFEPVSYEWFFDDPAQDPVPSTEKNATHVFRNPGIYNTKLKITGMKSGVVSEFSQFINVQTFDANYTENVVSGTKMKFSDTSSGFPTQWYWLFDDGYTSRDQNPEHEYVSSGTYNVTLHAWNELRKDFKTKEIVVL